MNKFVLCYKKLKCNVPCAHGGDNMYLSFVNSMRRRERRKPL